MTDTVTYAGDAMDGTPLFGILLAYPDPVPGDIPRPKRHIEAVTDLFGDLGLLTKSQAHANLAARDYGRYCAA